MDWCDTSFVGNLGIRFNLRYNFNFSNHLDHIFFKTAAKKSRLIKYDEKIEIKCNKFSGQLPEKIADLNLMSLS